jgi:voltage-gated potassium channel
MTDSQRQNFNRHYKRWQRHLSRFFRWPFVEITIALLIIASVVLTIIEVSLPPTAPHIPLIETTTRSITWVFVIELILRFLATPEKRVFWKQYWIDILAVLPAFRIFRVIRVVRLLRLVRTLRLFSLLKRYALAFPYFVRRSFQEYFIVFSLLILTIIFGSIAILIFEGNNNPNIHTWEEAVWFSVYSLFAGEPIPEPPASLGGRLISVMVIFMNVTLFAMFTGTVSAFMVEQFRRGERTVNWDELSGHTIICGWNRKAEIIVREYKAAAKSEDTPIIIIAQFEDPPTFLDPSLKSRVQFLNDDFTKVSALKRAGIDRAETCIILSDKTKGRSDQDADARTILAALTAEKLNPDVYTCAELINREYGSHLDIGHVNDYVVSEEHGGFLLAQAALNRGLMSLFSELLTYERGNQFYRLSLKPAWVGKTFLELFIHLKQTHDAILIAVCESNNQFSINPNNYIFKSTDSVIIIARQEIHW